MTDQATRTTVEWTLDGRRMSADIIGEVQHGSGPPLILEAMDLTAGLPWATSGFTVAALPAGLHEDLTLLVGKAVRDAVNDAGGRFPATADLESYHRHLDGVTATHGDVIHGDVIGRTREYLALERLGITQSQLGAIASEICGRAVTMTNPRTGESSSAIRIIRPSKHDENPVHRDPWLPFLADGINAYVPIAGSTRHSSLAVVPGSHRWSESETDRTVGGAEMNGTRYHVPAMVRARRPVDLVRPEVPPGHFMLFSPYLLHGASANLETERTRISLELRFYELDART